MTDFWKALVLVAVPTVLLAFAGMAGDPNTWWAGAMVFLLGSVSTIIFAVAREGELVRGLLVGLTVGGLALAFSRFFLFI